MSDNPAVLATFAQYAMVKTRGVLVLHMEVPLERQAEVFATLGYPLPGNEVWCGIARLHDQVPSAALTHVASEDAGEVLSPSVSPARNPDKSRAARDRYHAGDEMEQAVARSALLAKDPAFQRWLVVSKRERLNDASPLMTEERAAGYIRWYCDIESRRFIASDERAFDRFREIEASYQAETRHGA